MSDNSIFQNIKEELVASTEERTKRLAICEQCDRFTESKICLECNCFMPIKTWVQFKQCPKGKW